MAPYPRTAIDSAMKSKMYGHEELAATREVGWQVALKCLQTFLGSAEEPRQRLLLIYGATSVGMVAFGGGWVPLGFAFAAYMAALMRRDTQKKTLGTAPKRIRS